MHPILLHSEQFSFSLGAYGTLIALAVVTCFRIGPRWGLALEGIEPRTTRRVLCTVAVATFVGAHVHYLVNEWPFVVARARVGRFDTLLWTGIHAGGAIIGLALSLPLALRETHISLAKFADAIAPTVGMGIAIARLGCFLNGCCYGTPCSWPWCLAFPEPSGVWDLHQSLGLVAPGTHYSAPVHPLQLYFSAVGVLIVATAFWLYPRKRYDGQVALVCLVLFSTTSLALENLRGAHALRAYWGTVPQLTWTALAMTVLSVGALLVGEIRHRLPALRPGGILSA